MIAMIFEVWPYPAHRDDYLDTAAGLRGQAEAIDGFLSIERFQSLADPSKILSLGFFRDEEAVTTWRNSGQHRQAQALGRSTYFRDYRLRIAEVSRDYGRDQREEAPSDSLRVHDQQLSRT